jgi:SH3-like domain-containing protein
MGNDIAMLLRRLLAPIVLLALLLAAPPSAAEEGELPLPRFASIRSGEVNMRSGPGLDYPILWVLKREGMPVMIVDEFHHWRQIRHWDGETGWVHRSMLTGRRTLRIAEETLLRQAAREDSRPLARILPGAVITAEECDRDWCRVRAQVRHSGFVHRGAVWGLLEDESFR